MSTLTGKIVGLIDWSTRKLVKFNFNPSKHAHSLAEFLGSTSSQTNNLKELNYGISQMHDWWKWSTWLSKMEMLFADDNSVWNDFTFSHPTTGAWLFIKMVPLLKDHIFTSSHTHAFFLSFQLPRLWLHVQTVENNASWPTSI